jgi:hypothetical protein
MFSMKKYFLVLLSIFFFNSSCENKKKSLINKNLLLFKQNFIGELGSEEYDKFEKLAVKNKLEIKYLNDVVYVSFLEITNACSSFKGDINIKNDSIYLTYNTISDEVCTSTTITRFTYIINNNEEKKYKIIKKQQKLLLELIFDIANEFIHLQKFKLWY